MRTRFSQRFYMVCEEFFSKCLSHPTGVRVAQAVVPSPPEENRGLGDVFEGEGEEEEDCGYRVGSLSNAVEIASRWYKPQ